MSELICSHGINVIMKGGVFMSKKIISRVVASALILSLLYVPLSDESYAVVQSSNSVESKDAITVLEDNMYTVIKTDTIEAKELKNSRKSTFAGDSNAVLYYNNGKPLDASKIIVFEEAYEDELSNSTEQLTSDEEELRALCEAQGYEYVNDGEDTSETKVFGVYVYKTGSGNIGEIVITSNDDEMSIKEISGDIAEGINVGDKAILSSNATVLATTSNPIVKSYIKRCEVNDTLVAKINRTATLKRTSKNAEINGKACSLWNVDMFVQVTSYEGRRISTEYMWLNTNQSDQTMTKYSPVGDKGKSDGYELSFSAAGVGASISFGGNYKRTDLTSMEGKYGKWKFSTDTTAMKSKLTTQTAIRCTNTSGSITIKGKVQITLLNLVGRTYHSKQFTLGANTWTIDDR